MSVVDSTASPEAADAAAEAAPTPVPTRAALVPDSQSTRTARNVLVLGATSGIGRAVARRLGRDGDNVILAGRDVAEMERDAADLAIRHDVRAAVVPFDANAFDTHAAFFRDAAGRFPGGLDGVVLCIGYMADQKAAQRDFALALRTIHTNYASAVSLLEVAADYFERREPGLRGRGFICALSSVAGDRGRQSNYIYGSSKAALTAYLQGLRNRLTRAGVPVVTIKPGFVDTSMTWGLVKPGSPVVASPERVADDVVRAVRTGAAEVYTPWFWQGIMAVIKAIPEAVFRRMRL